MEDFPRALKKDFNMGLGVEPNNAMAWYCRGQCKVALGDLQGSIADFTKAIELGQLAAFADRGISYPFE